jgi:hypothetical protein
MVLELKIKCIYKKGWPEVSRVNPIQMNAIFLYC